MWVPLDYDWPYFFDGKFRKVLTGPMVAVPPNPGYIFRFEAENHAAFVTRRYGPNEGNVELDARLKPAQDILAIAYSPDGKPPANAQVGLIFDGTDARLVPGGFDFMMGNAPVWARRADSTGWFRIPGEEKIDGMVVASPEGFAETSIDELRKAKAVRLPKWGAITGTLQGDGGPIPGVRIVLGSTADAERIRVPLAQQAFETVTEEDGPFVFPKVPPVTLQLHAIVNGRPPQPIGVIQAEAGKTAQVRAVAIVSRK